jgi:hypothetical protein
LRGTRTPGTSPMRILKHGTSLSSLLLLPTLRGINTRREYTDKTEEIEPTEKTKESIDRNNVPNNTYSMSVHDTCTFLHEGNLHVSYGSRIFLKKGSFRVVTDRTTFTNTLVIKRKGTGTWDSLTWSTDNVAIYRYSKQHF